jgi:hypothetical protein
MLPVVVAVVAALLPIVALYRLVARHDAKVERTATEEMWSRDLEFWKSHNERPATRDGVTGLGSNRAGLGLGATPNHTRPMGIRK